MSQIITIALAKGRLLEDTLPLLARMGIEPEEDLQRTRKLIVGSNRPGLRFLIVRATDVPTYVGHGAAELGISGKDTLLEERGDGYYEPLDLGIGRCRLVVAGFPGGRIEDHYRPAVATKFVASATRYFFERGVQAEIIKLYGSIELGPLVGLADFIVDLVDTGNTLRANGLVELELIAPISARLIVNRTAFKRQHSAVSGLVNEFEAAVAATAVSA